MIPPVKKIKKEDVKIPSGKKIYIFSKKKYKILLHFTPKK
jgi:hypothetical protein